MSLIDRIGGLVQQNKRVNKGMGRDKNGIEIWNRDGDNIIKTVFPESSSSESKKKIWDYYFYPVDTKFEDTYLLESDQHKTEVIKEKGGILGIDEFFSPGVTVLELGCGGGQAAIDLARKYRGVGVNYLATDHEMGEAIAKPINLLPNLVFEKVDWNHMDFADGSIDRILSKQGVARYGGEKAAREMTRVAKIGAIFRGDQDTGVYMRRNFSDHLYEMGWNVWRMKNADLIVAQKVR